MSHIEISYENQTPRIQEEESCDGLDFYGVYLLCSESTEKRYRRKCYIGFTVNPSRRIRQHNRGRDFGGANKTNNKGPWKMVMIVHGFPNNISALQFEWAWQQPGLSNRLKNFPELKKKLPQETYFQYNFRILNRMLLVGPWTRLPLIVRWLEPDYEVEFPVDTFPPRHIKIVKGRITISMSQVKLSETNELRKMWASECHLCMKKIENPERSGIGCVNNICKLTCHIICLANYLIASDVSNRGHYIPIKGECPLCEIELFWTELLQKNRKIKSKNQQLRNEEEGFDEIPLLAARISNENNDINLDDSSDE